MNSTTDMLNKMSSSIEHSYGLHEFYKDKTILMTGSTGFLGVILVEKLIRSFPEVRKLFVIIRGKRGETSSERMNNYFDSPVFNRVKEEYPSSLSKVVFLEGDVLKEHCGLQMHEIESIHKDVNLVIHCAATVKFNEFLRTTVNINVRGTLNMLKLCSGIKNLKSFIYVSTMYSNSYSTRADEKIYPHPISPEKLIDLVDILDDDTLEKITPIMINNWPNIYSYTKNAAENLVYSYRHQLPVTIFRPSVITAPYKEPIPGWINKYMGPYGWMTATGLGFCRVIHASKPESNSHIVPCDYVAHAILAVLWYTGHQSEKSAFRVINYTSEGNALSWRELRKHLMATLKRAPFENCIWYPMSIIISDVKSFKLYNFVLQRLPAYIIDFFSLVLNRQPKFIKLENKMAISFEETWPFLREFQFQTDNIYTILEKLSDEDKKVLTFDMKLVSWDEYFKDSALGIKKYLLKDSMTKESITRARNKFFWLYVLDKLFKYGLLCIVIYLLKYIYKRFM